MERIYSNRVNPTSETHIGSSMLIHAEGLARSFDPKEVIRSATLIIDHPYGRIASIKRRISEIEDLIE